MDNWQKQKNKKGRVYYYNIVTKKSQWKPPSCWIEPPDDDDDDHDEHSKYEADKPQQLRTSKDYKTDVAHGGNHFLESQYTGSMQMEGLDGNVPDSKESMINMMVSNTGQENQSKDGCPVDSSYVSNTQTVLQTQGGFFSHDQQRATEIQSTSVNQKVNTITSESQLSTVTCPNCGAVNFASAKFCCECGRNVQEIPKLCQMETCKSFGSSKSVVFLCNDELLTMRNSGRTLYLCYHCAEMIRTFPFFEGVDMTQIANIPQDIDDGRSVIRFVARIFFPLPLSNSYRR